jgi:hypothetical protein
MTAATLEQRYRRLLACYPAEHRKTYGEEMLGVLLASAQPGQRRPGISDILDLFGGAARVRLRSLLTGTPDPGWRNALALTSLITPILVAALTPDAVGWFGPPSWLQHIGPARLAAAGIALVPVALGLLRLRRLAALAAAATVAWVIAQAWIGGQIGIPSVSAFIVLLFVQAFALAAAPGPRHALTLIRPGPAALAVPWLLTAAYMAGLIPKHYPVPLPVAEAGVAVVALAGLPALAAPGGRRLIALIVAIPLSGMLSTILTFADVHFYALTPAARMLALYLPPVAVAGLAFLAARRSSKGVPSLTSA